MWLVMRVVMLIAASLVLTACSGIIGDTPASLTSDGTRESALCVAASSDPGRVTMRRLSRIEYRNTLRDLLGDTIDRTEALPADDLGFGFDVIGDLLSTSVNHITAYVDIGFDAVAKAITRDKAKLFTCVPKNNDDLACFERIVHAFATRAFRRPLIDGDKATLANVFAQARASGDDFDHAVELALVTVLSSPSFIFRPETQGGTDDVQSLGPYELASRLSYFVWSSMPDDALLAAAANGKLATARGLAEETRRLLADPRADGLADHFAAAWLGVTALADAAPQAPGFDEALRSAMAAETRALFKYVLETNAPISELFSARYTFVNARLATHYGMTGAYGDELTKVALPLSRPPGVLGHASYLTATSHPDITSPVRRGRFVLDAMLCEPPPPPPGDVETKKGEVDPGAPKRTQMEQHRTDAACAGCHMMMDPIGFAFEGFDTVGRPRTQDETGHTVETRGELVDGRTFDGPAELVAALAGEPDTVACAAKKLTTFALGRGLAKSDDCVVQTIAEQLGAHGGLEDLVIAVATSRPFVARRSAQ